MAIYHVHKSIAGFSAILGFILLVVCIWTFCSLLYGNEVENPRKNKNSIHGQGSRENRNGVREWSTRQGSSALEYPYSSTSKPKNILRFSDGTKTGYPISSKPEHIFRLPEEKTFHKTETNFWAIFEQMPKTFKQIIMGCVWVAIIAGLVQFCSCFLILCSSKLNLPLRAKYFVAVHFFVFILLVISFSVPVSYDRDEDTFFSMTGFNVKVKKSINGFSSNFISFLRYDLNSYYTFLGSDMLLVFLFMISICCLMRYETFSYYDQG